MAMQLVAETDVPGIVSTLSEALAYVSPLIDTSDDYVRPSYVALRKFILDLCDQLNLCKNQSNDEGERERLLLRARISASKTFSLGIYCSNNTRPKYPLRLILVPCVFLCLGFNVLSYVREKAVQSHLAETKKLTDDLSTFLRGTESDQQHGQKLERVRYSLAGGKRLELVTPRNLHSKIRRGEEVPFTVLDSSQRRVYTVKTWLNDPKSGKERRMSASLENATGGIYDIRHPEEKQNISGSKEMNAFIVSGGSLQGTVTSALTENRVDNSPRRAGSLLLIDPLKKDWRKGCDYDVFLVFSNINILGLHSEGVGRLRVRGIKDRVRTEYKCLVEGTEEVLAIYEHSHKNETGVLHLLGVGHKPEVRDLIFSTFVAMGLTRNL